MFHGGYAPVQAVVAQLRSWLICGDARRHARLDSCGTAAVRLQRQCFPDRGQWPASTMSPSSFPRSPASICWRQRFRSVLGHGRLRQRTTPSGARPMRPRGRLCRLRVPLSLLGAGSSRPRPEVGAKGRLVRLAPRSTNGVQLRGFCRRNSYGRPNVNADTSLI